MSALLKIIGVSKYYGNLAANKNIDLEVTQGTIHAIVGENGAGKSTLMNVLSGVVMPTSGDIELKGKKIVLRNPNDATKANIGMVQQEFMLFGDLSVLENVVIGHEDVNWASFLETKTSEIKISDICEEYNFRIPLNRKVKNLPIAVQQQVEIVKVLFKDAEIVILDEPTAVLTPQGIRGLFRAMRSLVANGKTILFITHKLKEVLEISDVITVLKDGVVVGTVKTKETTEDDLARMMVGREVFLKITKEAVYKPDIEYQVIDLSVSNDQSRVVVNNISFAIKYGEIVGVAGIAGNGQNELVEALTGLRKIDSGRIIYRQQDIANGSPRDNRLMKIGYVPQDRRITGSSIDSTIVENTMIGKHLTSFSKKWLIDYDAAKDFTGSVVDRFDVRVQSLNDPARSLSGGNLQKLIVGREFSQENEFLIIEDPTRGIDIGSMEFIWNEIVENSKYGNGCLIITYDLNEAIQLCDRILVLYQGAIVKEILRKDFDEQLIGRYMLGGKVDEAY